MLPSRRRFRDAVARGLTPAEAWLYVKTVFVLQLPYPRWMVLAFLDRAMVSVPAAHAYAKAIREGMQVKVVTRTAKITVPDPLAAAETELADDPGVQEALGLFETNDPE